MIQQQLHSSHHFFADGVQQSVANVHTEAQQEFDDFEVLVLNGDKQGRAAEGVDAVDVDLEVDLCLLMKNRDCDSKSGLALRATLVFGLKNIYN